MPLLKDPIKREEYLRDQKERSLKLTQDSEYRDKQRAGCQKRSRNPRWQHNHTKAMQKLAQNPVWRDNVKKSNQVLSQNPKWILKNIESHIGGFWYGNVRYSDPPPYCEFWCPDLFKRIDEAQTYQSILSGKTKIDNGNRALSRHHVYWQPKACCEWDEDMQGYYAMINTGTPKKSNWHKHYIPGDPNKFVLLTRREHGMIAKDKIGWIRTFEDLIETKLGGICYIPKKVK